MLMHEIKIKNCIKIKVKITIITTDYVQTDFERKKNQYYLSIEIRKLSDGQLTLG
jgi:hypothetical protein